MTSPLPLPDWVPWWVHLALLLALLFVALMFLLMPFSVFGLKTRLDQLDARLDEIQAEIRNSPSHLSEIPPDVEDEHAFVHRSGARGPVLPAPAVARRDASRPGRTEPRLY